jgi:hypothetical protein
MIDGITDFVFLINKNNADVSICAPKEIVVEYDDSFELLVDGGYGKYFFKTDWKLFDKLGDIEKEETYDF